jgi:hypothetical protein
LATAAVCFLPSSHFLFFQLPYKNRQENNSETKENYSLTLSSSLPLLLLLLHLPGKSFSILPTPSSTRKLPSNNNNRNYQNQRKKLERKPSHRLTSSETAKTIFLSLLTLLLPPAPVSFFVILSLLLYLDSITLS